MCSVLPRRAEASAVDRYVGGQNWASKWKFPNNQDQFPDPKPLSVLHCLRCHAQNSLSGFPCLRHLAFVGFATPKSSASNLNPVILTDFGNGHSPIHISNPDPVLHFQQPPKHLQWAILSLLQIRNVLMSIYQLSLHLTPLPDSLISVRGSRIQAQGTKTGLGDPETPCSII